MKTTDEVLKSFVIRHKDVEHYEKIKILFKSTSIRKALKDSSCDSYEQLVKLCKYYENRRPLPNVWEPPK